MNVKDLIQAFLDIKDKKIDFYNTRSGVYICSGTYMIEDQKYWDEEDIAKDEIFREDEIYLCAEGEYPEAITSEDLLEIIED